MVCIALIDREQRPLVAFTAAYIAWGYLDKFVFDLVGLDGPVFWLVCIGVPTCFLAVLYIAGMSRAIPLASYGLTRREPVRRLAQDAFFCYLAYVAIIFFGRELISLGVDIGKAMVNLNGGLPRQATTFRAAVLLSAALILGSVLEEVVYRGMLRRLFVSPRNYVLFSTLLFAGVHFHQGIVAVLVAGVVGLAACALYLKMRTLAPLVLAHVGANLTVVAMT